MNKLISVAVLSLASASVFAAPTFNVPEPEVFSLMAIGALAFLVSKRKSK